MTADPEHLLIRRDLIATPVGGGDQVVISGVGAPELMPDPVARALLSCRSFDSLDGHVGRAMSQLKLPETLRPLLRQALAGLRARGLLVSWREATSLEQAEAEAEAPAPIDGVAVLTRNRPQAAVRALRSHVEQAREQSSRLRFAVMDSSPDAADARQTRQAVAGLVRETGADIHYADAEDRRGFADRLAAMTGIDPAVIAFALSDSHGCGHDAGSNRNALLLGHVGRRFLSSDDDVVCAPHGGPAPGHRLRVTEHNDPTKVRLFESPAQALSAVPAAGENVLRAHAALLGRSLRALLAEQIPDSVQFEPLGAPTLRAFLDGRARVAVTSSGLVGDSGARYPAFYLSRPEIAEQLGPASEEDYRRLVMSRQVLRMVATPTITAGRFLMSTHVAFDQRALLPPFFPVLRGEDLTFGHMLRLLNEGNLIGHVALAIEHRPVDNRVADQAGLWPTDLTPTFAAILDTCLGSAASALAVGADARRRLRLLGRHLHELGHLPGPEFDRHISSALAEGAGARLSIEARALEKLGSTTSTWAGDLHRLHQHNLASLAVMVRPTAADLTEVHGREQAAQLTRTMIGRFGQLLERWSDVLAAAGDLEGRGQGLFRPVAVG